MANREDLVPDGSVRLILEKSEWHAIKNNGSCPKTKLIKHALN